LLAALACSLGLFFFVASRGGSDEADLAERTTSASAAIAATMTVQERAAVEALLRTASLRPEDLPEGFDLEEAWFVTKEEAARQTSGFSSAATPEDLDRLGWVLGYHATYGEPSSLQLAIGLYRDSQGASEAFNLYREQQANPEPTSEGDSGESSMLRDVSISPMPFVDVGEERMASELRFTVHDAGLDRDFGYSVRSVVIRRGQAVGAISVAEGELNTPLTAQQLQDLARTLDERMKNALE